MRDVIKLILFSAVTAPAMAACSGEPNPDQNVIITENVPADAEIEALPVDEGGVEELEANSTGVGHLTVNSN